jgi:hypothetical protein
MRLRGSLWVKFFFEDTKMSEYYAATCSCCGKKLTEEEQDAGREECFDCYNQAQD